MNTTNEELAKKLEKYAANGLMAGGNPLTDLLLEAATRLRAGEGVRIRPLDTAPRGEDALEPAELDVHEGAWAVVIGTNGKAAGWIDTHAMFAHQIYCDQILPSTPQADEVVEADEDIFRLEETLGALEGMHGEGWINITMAERRLFARLLRDHIATMQNKSQPLPDRYWAIPPGTDEHKTFTIPEGYEAVLDSEGRATGEVQPTSTHRHVKTGGEYVMLGIGKMQAERWYRRYGIETATDVDMTEVAIYRSVDDGSLWVRPREEFEDGRFEEIAKDDL